MSTNMSAIYFSIITAVTPTFIDPNYAAHITAFVYTYYATFNCSVYTTKFTSICATNFEAIPTAVKATIESA